MRRLIVTVILLASVSGCHDGTITLGGDTSSATTTVAPSRFNTATAGSVTGRVRWTGAVPTVPDIAVERLLADGVKIEHVTRPNPHAPQVDSSGGVGGAVVFIRGVDPSLARPWDLPPVTVDMRDDGPIVRQGNNSPALIGFAHRGDDLTMVSKQTRFQMVRARGAAFFTLSLPDPDQPRTRPLSEIGRVEISSAVGDTAVRGHIFVDDQPYYALTDSTGAFELSQVPAGNYQLVCWRPNWRIERQERDPETLLRVRLFFQAALETSVPVAVRPGEATTVMLEVGAE
jgi:hypothetical protein